MGDENQVKIDHLTSLLDQKKAALQKHKENISQKQEAIWRHEAEREVYKNANLQGRATEIDSQIQRLSRDLEDLMRKDLREERAFIEALERTIKNLKE